MSRSRSIHLTLHIHKDPAAMAERAAHYLSVAFLPLRFLEAKPRFLCSGSLPDRIGRNACPGKKSYSTGATNVASALTILKVTMAWPGTNCFHMSPSPGITG